jgi:hypothetical protein
MRCRTAPPTLNPTGRGVIDVRAPWARLRTPPPSAAVPRVGSRRNASIIAAHAAARSHRCVGGRSAFGGRGAWEAEHAPPPRPPAIAPRRRPSHMAARPPDRGAAQMTPWPIIIGHRSAAVHGRTTSGPNMSSPERAWAGAVNPAKANGACADAQAPTPMGAGTRRASMARMPIQSALTRPRRPGPRRGCGAIHPTRTARHRQTRRGRRDLYENTPSMG